VLKSRSALLVVALVSVLVLPACAALTGTGDPNVAATVNGTAIPVTAVEERFEQAKNDPQVAQQLEGDTEGAFQSQIQAQILTQLVLSELLDQWAAELDIEATEADVEEERTKLIEQLGGQKAFDKAVEESGLSEEDVNDQIRQRVLQDRIAEKVAEGVEVTDADIQKFYDENAETRFGPKATARHILVKDKAKAESILEELRNGGDFAKLAQKHSTDPGSAEQGGELPEFGRGQMVAPFEEAVFNAKQGDIIGPVKTDFGYHVIEVLQLSQGQSIDEVREEISTELGDTKKSEVLKEELAKQTSEAEVDVNPRFGTWDSKQGLVEPTKPLGETSEEPAPAGSEGLGGIPSEGSAPVPQPTG
jgi:parvulin-like peptidyl-prolyl isomerase